MKKVIAKGIDIEITTKEQDYTVRADATVSSRNMSFTKTYYFPTTSADNIEEKILNDYTLVKMKCSNCGFTYYKGASQQSLHVCPICGEFQSFKPEELVMVDSTNMKWEDSK